MAFSQQGREGATARHFRFRRCRAYHHPGWQGRDVYAFTRAGDTQAQSFARDLGAKWAGSSDESPPEVLDAVIIFAPIGDLVPIALRAVRKGGRVVCGGIHMSDIPAMPYSVLWEERELVSVANLTRKDAEEFFPIASQAGVNTHTKTYRLEDANKALTDLRAGRFSGAAVYCPLMQAPRSGHWEWAGQLPSMRQRRDTLSVGVGRRELRFIATGTETGNPAKHVGRHNGAVI